MKKLILKDKNLKHNIENGKRTKKTKNIKNKMTKHRV